MNARMFAALPLAVVIALFAAPTLAQNVMPASSASTMSHDSMHRDAMKGSMHKHGMMMKKDSMQHTMMKHTTMHHGAKMKKGDSMKMDGTGGAPKSSGG